jgi:hypothetical protein
MGPGALAVDWERQNMVREMLGFGTGPDVELCSRQRELDENELHKNVHNEDLRAGCEVKACRGWSRKS